LSDIEDTALAGLVYRESFREILLPTGRKGGNAFVDETPGGPLFAEGGNRFVVDEPAMRGVEGDGPGLSLRYLWEWELVVEKGLDLLKA